MISFLSHSPCASFVAVGTEDGYLYVLDSSFLSPSPSLSFTLPPPPPPSTATTLVPQHKTGINHISWHPCAPYLLSSSNDSFIVYKIEKDSKSTAAAAAVVSVAITVVEEQTPTPNGPLFSSAFSLDGLLLAVGSFDQNIYIYSFASNGKTEHVKTIRAAHSEPITCLIFTKKHLISSSYDGFIRFYSLNTDDDSAATSSSSSLFKPTYHLTPTIQADTVELAPISFITVVDDDLLVAALNSTVYLIKGGAGGGTVGAATKTKCFRGHSNIQYCLNAIVFKGKIAILDEKSNLHTWSIEDPSSKSFVYLGDEDEDNDVIGTKTSTTTKTKTKTTTATNTKSTYHPSSFCNTTLTYAKGMVIYSKEQ